MQISKKYKKIIAITVSVVVTVIVIMISTRSAGDNKISVDIPDIKDQIDQAVTQFDNLEKYTNKESGIEILKPEKWLVTTFTEEGSKVLIMQDPDGSVEVSVAIYDRTDSETFSGGEIGCPLGMGFNSNDFETINLIDEPVLLSSQGAVEMGFVGDEFSLLPKDIESGELNHIYKENNGKISDRLFLNSDTECINEFSISYTINFEFENILWKRYKAVIVEMIESIKTVDYEDIT